VIDGSCQYNKVVSMNRLRRAFKGLFLVCVAAFLCVFPYSVTSTLPLPEEPVMRAHFIAVGQGHTTLLEFPCGAVLIDAGSQDNKHTQVLIDYLARFFARRADLNNTLESVIITHNHIDHTKALKAVVQGFTVKRYLDNGMLTGSGRFNPIWIRRNATTGGRSIEIREISDADISVSGLTDSFVDPLSCADLKLLHGRLDDNPGWSAGVFKNQNNQGIVVRVDFGTSSFLFTGDLQEEAINQMLARFANTNPSPLDVDVYQVGHHGSHNATTVGLLDAVTPKLAVIPVGKWDFGKGSSNAFTTFSYGHPRKVVVDLLNGRITGLRGVQVRVKVATGPRKFVDYMEGKKVYATGWDGTVIVRATEAGDYAVTTRAIGGGKK